MREPEPGLTLARIREVIEVRAYLPPPGIAALEETERALGVPFPGWLRDVYLACNGFEGPAGVRYLWPLEGREGVLLFTKFLRSEDWSPSWLDRAIIFGDNGVGGSITTHWAALDGKLIEWCYGDGAAYSVLDCGLLGLWKREQDKWDAVRAREA